MMEVKAIHLSDDPYSVRVAYEKNGKLYIRDGKDGFKVGTPVQADIASLGKWGFYEVKPNPRFHDRTEIINNLDKFQMDGKGLVTYYG